MNRSPRTALVLSGGGLVGGAWMIGALHAIATETGWDPGTADHVLGTSAGSMIGALLSSAVPTWMFMDFVAGKGGGPLADLGMGYRVHWSFPKPILASPQLALRSIREPWKYGPAGIFAWLPQGVLSTEPLKEMVHRIVPSHWSAHPNLWVVAVDYDSGQRVVFGRPNAPDANLSEAVAASCAIPGFYRPVDIKGRRYVDGGMYSASNADLLKRANVELVVILQPMSSRYRGGVLDPTGAIASLVRGNTRRRVDREVALLRRTGKHVILLEPNREDVATMGFNYMSRSNLDRVAVRAMQSVKASLVEGEAGRRLEALPKGAEQRLRKPAVGSAKWPAALFPPLLKSA